MYVLRLQLTDKTRAALDKQVSQKIAAAMPVRAADKQAPAQYIRYIPIHDTYSARHLDTARAPWFAISKNVTDHL